MGETIDPNLVNVVVTVDGNTFTLPRRSDPNDECLVDGCWDYDAEGNIVIIGISCDDISGATEAEVDIEVGCETILK